ncbi:MAG: methionine synthase [Clostridia bacterium]|nr:methionine synthase [Clostridia bacterium]
MEEGYGRAVPTIELREALHYMGWRGRALEPEFVGQIRACEGELREVARPQMIYRVFPYAPETNRLEGTVYQPAGRDIRQLLRSCRQAVLFAATLGADADRLIARTMLRNGGNGLVMDAVASAMIEAVCNQAETELARHRENVGQYLTDRFSPGYGDMPLSDGGRICTLLETPKRIGLTVTGSGIMLPQKSVTAVLGISPVKQEHRSSPCQSCAMRKECPLAERKDDHDGKNSYPDGRGDGDHAPACGPQSR